MKNNFKFDIKYFFGAMILVLAINYNTFIGNSENIEQFSGNTSIEIVEKGSIKKTIEVVGDAELVDEQSLSFNKVGTVTDVYFGEGDTVRKGETIAKLDDSDAYRNIEDAKISLANAKISLEQLYETEDESKIKQAKNSIFVSETNYNTSLKELDNLKITQANSIQKLVDEINTYKQEIENTSKEKENSLSTKKSSKNTIIINIEDNLKSYLLSIEDIIEESDTILGVSELRKDNNDDYDDYLGAKDVLVKNKSISSLKESLELYEKLNESLNLYDYSGDSYKIIHLLNSYLEVFNKLYETTDYLYEAIDNSIISIGSLGEAEISSMKQTISQSRSNSLSKIDSINSDINSINSLTDTDLESATSELTITKMQTSLEQMIADLRTTKTKYEIEYNSKEDEVSDRKEDLEISKISLEELLEGPTEANVTKAKNSIIQAELKLASAYEDLEDYILASPFNGVVRKIYYMPGDNLKDDNDKYVYIENPNLLEVSVMLDQIDIVKVEIGDMAIVTFDAYVTSPVNAKISNIDTTPVKSSGVVSYEVKLILDDPDFDKKVLSGMTSDVEIINESKDDILLLKTNAIKTESDEKYVILENNTKQIIETGLTGDGKTEIISGLSAGDKVLVGDFNIVSEESATTLFGDGPGSGKGQIPPQ